MAFENVPWAVGNGAAASVEVARLLAHVAFNGNEGVLGAGDLAVTALTTPGGSVQIAPGACAVLNRSPGQTYQAYAGRATSTTQVTVPATGSSAGRTDLLVARVEDPSVDATWPIPADPTTGPYFFPRLITNVAAGTKTVTELNLGYSAIPLARLTIPANTSAITQAMITDLRTIANPRRDRRIYTVNPATTITLSSASIADWFGSWSIPIPTWATRAVILVNLGGVRHARLSTTVNGTANGQVRAALGTVFTQTSNYDVETSSNNIVSRFTFSGGDTVSIPSNLRGTTQTLRIQGNKLAGNVAVYADSATFASVDIEFQESAS